MTRVVPSLVAAVKPVAAVRKPRPRPQEPAAPAIEDLSGAFRALSLLEKAASDLRASLAAIEHRQREFRTEAAPPAETNARVAYRVSEAARLVGVSGGTLRREVANGNLPARMAGKIILISHEALTEYAQGRAARKEPSA